MTTITCALDAELRAWQAFTRGWESYQTGLRLLHRRDDLKGLVRWAKRKRLGGPLAYYQSLLTNTELQLLRLTLCSPHTSRWTRLLYTLVAMLFHAPPQYRRGAAQKYRLRKESLRYK